MSVKWNKNQKHFYDRSRVPMKTNSTNRYNRRWNKNQKLLSMEEFKKNNNDNRLGL